MLMSVWHPRSVDLGMTRRMIGIFLSQAGDIVCRICSVIPYRLVGMSVDNGEAFVLTSS